MILTILADTGIIVALIGVFGTFVKSVFDNKRLAGLQQDEIERATTERKLMLKGLLIVLRKLNDEDLDGDIKQAIESLEGFLLEASHKTRA